MERNSLILILAVLLGTAIGIATADGPDTGDQVIAGLQRELFSAEAIVTEALQQFLKGDSDAAEELVNKCRTSGVTIDLVQLKREFLECRRVATARIEAPTDRLRSRQDLFTKRVADIGGRLAILEPLHPHQRRFLTEEVLTPYCSALMASVDECLPERSSASTKYPTMVRAQQECMPEYERVGDEMLRVALRDLCRNNGSWALDWMSNRPAQCVGAMKAAAEGEEHQARVERLKPYSKQVSGNTGKQKTVESLADLCELTGEMGGMVGDVLTAECKENQEPAKIFLHTFRETRDFWNAKCSGCSAGAWWPLSILSFLVISLRNV